MRSRAKMAKVGDNDNGDGGGDHDKTMAINLSFIDDACSGLAKLRA